MASRLVAVSTLQEYLDVEDTAGKAALLERFLAGAEALAERYCRRRFSPGIAGVGDQDIDYAVRFTTRGKSSIRVPDLRKVTSIVHHGTILTEDYYDLGYRRSPNYPSTHLEVTGRGGAPSMRWGQVSTIGGLEKNDLVVTGRWGFAECPDDVAHAICLIAAKGWKRRDSGYADHIIDESTGGFRLAQAIPLDAKAMLDGHRVFNVGLVGT